MRIYNNPVNNVIRAKEAETPKEKQGVNFGNNMQQLPANYSVGMSQVNSNVPIGYAKLGEIPIPGLQEKASVFKLANGQRVIILPKKGPTQIKTTFNVGSLNETEDIRGMSHYIEHNLFNGSKGLAPKEYDKRVSSMGGYTNASTSFNTTDYYMNLQLLDDSFLEKGIKLNAAQTQYPTFPPEQLEKEKEAVKSEIDMYKDNIEDVAMSRALKNLFNINTQSTNFILGTKQNINSFNQAKVMDYYNTWYTPDNAVTVITGDVDVNETIGLVSKYFNKPADYSKINQRHAEPITYPTKPVRTDIVQKGSPYSNISMGFAIPENTPDKDIHAINLLSDILYSPNSRLTKKLDKYGLSIPFFTQNMQNSPNSAKALEAVVNLPEEQVEDVLKIIYEEINHIANNPPTMEEFQDVQNSALKRIDSVAEYSEGINATLTQMALKNDYNYLANKKAIISTLTPADITAVAKKYMDLNKVSICVAHAEKTTPEIIGANYQKINKSAQVSFGKSNPLTNIQSDMSKVKEFKLWNNIETTIVPATSSGKSAMQMTIQTDTMKDVPQPAISVLSELLNRGSIQSGVEQYNKNLSKNDIGLGFGVSTEGIEVYANFYDDKLPNTLAQMKEVLAMPNFTETEFQRAKQTIKDSLLSERKSPEKLANKTLYPDIKAFDSTEEQLKQLEQLTLSDVQNLYNRILSTSQCEVTCTMPVEEKPYMGNILNNELSAGLPMFQQAQINRSLNTQTYVPNKEARTIAVAEENAQAQILQTYTFPKSMNIDDMVKIDLLNTILGRGMSSRLFTSLREQEKLCYHVSSYQSGKNNTGEINLVIETTTDPETKGEGSPENATKAINAFNKNVHMLKTELVSEQELKQAKTKLKTMILNSREANADTNEHMHSARNSAYGIKHIETLYAAIDKMTVQDIQAAANYVFKNPPLTSIVASKKTLDALNL